MLKHKNIFILSLSLSGGGAERVAVNLADGLANAGHRITLYVQKEKLATYQPASNVTIKYYPNVRLSCLRILWHFKIIWYICTEIRKNKPDVLIGFMWYHTFVAKMAQWLSGRRIPVIYSEHNALERPIIEPMSRKESFFKFYFSRICDAYVLLTEADRKYGENLGLKNIVVIPNPLGLSSAVEVPPKKNIVISVGRLNVWRTKGWDVLLASWGNLVTKYLEWELHIVGAGTTEDRQRLMEFAEKYEARERFRIIDHTQDIEKLYQPASVFVLSSRHEGFPLVVLEAMSQGCACVATSFKGRMKDIITDGYDGLLCNPDDVDELSNKLGTLVSNKELRSKLQNNALKSVERFSIKQYITHWETLIGRLC